MSLRVDIRKKYRDFTLEMAFESGDGPLALLGASGSGKSLTLKCIAGLISPDEGVIQADGHILFDSAAKIDLKPQERRVGYLFQNYALFPNMTVRQNIAIAADIAHKNRAARDAEVSVLLTRYGIEGLAGRYPVQLSGGEQQRTALARLFACRPKTLLLDEPFSALDTFLRENMQAELRRIIREYDGSVVLVTHSRDEAYRIADDLVILDRGRPVIAGSVQGVFAHPGNARAARITGCKNISVIERTGVQRFFARDWGVELETAENVYEKHVYAGIRAHDLKPVEPCGITNIFLVDFVDEIDGPFEKDVIFNVRDAPTKDTGHFKEAGADKLWWITEKRTDISGVSALYISPEDIMLLEA